MTGTDLVSIYHFTVVPLAFLFLCFCSICAVLFAITDDVGVMIVIMVVVVVVVVVVIVVAVVVLIVPLVTVVVAAVVNNFFASLLPVSLLPVSLLPPLSSSSPLLLSFSSSLSPLWSSFSTEYVVNLVMQSMHVSSLHWIVICSNVRYHFIA